MDTLGDAVIVANGKGGHPGLGGVCAGEPSVGLPGSVETDKLCSLQRCEIVDLYTRLPSTHLRSNGYPDDTNHSFPKTTSISLI